MTTAPLFGSTALAARIEQAECTMLRAAARASASRPEARTLLQPVAGGLAVYTVPGAPANKVAGMGFSQPLDEATLDDVERAFAERGAAVQAEVSCLADPSVAACLTARGYRLVGFENVLGLALPAAVPAGPGPSVEVLRAGTGDLAEWLDAVVTAFANPDAQGLPAHESYPREMVERIMLDLAADPAFHLYVARRDGVTAGGGSLRLTDGIAQLCGAGTLPAHRRRGVQSALLARRLADAARAGCDVAVVTTQPGSKSQENAQRSGFALLYTRAVLVKPAP
jgi:hypothetical protein